MSDIDPCDVLARHQDHRGQWGNGACTSRFGGPEHCLPYLLASAVVRVTVVLDEAYREDVGLATWSQHPELELSQRYAAWLDEEERAGR